MCPGSPTLCGQGFQHLRIRLSNICRFARILSGRRIRHTYMAESPDRSTAREKHWEMAGQDGKARSGVQKPVSMEEMHFPNEERSTCALQRKRSHSEVARELLEPQGSPTDSSGEGTQDAHEKVWHVPRRGIDALGGPWVGLPTFSGNEEAFYRWVSATSPPQLPSLTPMTVSHVRVRPSPMAMPQSPSSYAAHWCNTRGHMACGGCAAGCPPPLPRRTPRRPHASGERACTVGAHRAYQARGPHATPCATRDVNP